MLPVLHLDPGDTSELANCRRVLALLEVKLCGTNGAFQMGVAGWRFVQMKRTLGGRTGIVAVLEEWPVICSVVVRPPR